MRYAEYVVPVKDIMLKKAKSFVTLGKGQYKVKIAGEKHIYMIPPKHSYQYISSIVIGI